MKIDDLMPDEHQPTERELLFAEAHKRFKEDLARIDNMILTVVKAQIMVERFMIGLLEAYGRDPKHFFFTAQKITECKTKIDPPEVGQTMWELFELARTSETSSSTLSITSNSKPRRMRCVRLTLQSRKASVRGKPFET